MKVKQLKELLKGVSNDTIVLVSMDGENFESPNAAMSGLLEITYELDEDGKRDLPEREEKEIVVFALTANYSVAPPPNMN